MAQSTVPATAPFQQPQYAEDLGAYRKGGLQPVHIGDEIGGNYVIIDKLGHGDISTVWLATPMAQPDTCVALAVHMAEASEAAEARVASRWSNLNKGDTDHPGKANILLPQDWFTIQGPNGAHFCLVTPVAGQSVSAATKRDLIEGSRPLPLPTAKRVALGLVRGLQYSHSMKLAHGGKLVSIPSQGRDNGVD
jgi:serine/threonine protein kinase